jgi:exopolysaccharide biosynthesis predicted pyruvyltransferase EpsI
MNADIAQSLNAYSIYVNYWHPNSGDTFILLGERDFLQKNIGKLSVEQTKQLSKIDTKVLALASIPYDVEDDNDFRTLQLCVDVINGIEI